MTSDSLPAFIDELSSAAPVPGGGSVAALEAACSAGLLTMVANLTMGRKKYAAVEDRVSEIRTRAQTLGRRATALIEEDIRAYGAVHAAMTLPKETDEERSRRRAAMQSALKGAAEPPLATMRVATDLVDLAGQLVEIGNRSAVSDVGTAALAGRAAFHSARLNVEINFSAVQDQTWLAATRDELEGLRSPDDTVQDIMLRVEAAIRGEPS